MKILFNRKPIDGPWGGGNLLVQALCSYAKSHGINIVYEFEAGIDAILMLDPRPNELGIGVEQIYSHSKAFNVPVIHRVNECDARKGTTDVDKMLQECSKISKTTVFVSEWMKNYHANLGWFCSDQKVIYNGVDHEHFKPTEKLANGKINIVAHHWSDNYKKGFDVYEDLDRWVARNPDFTFTYIGRERGTFKNTTVIAPIHGKTLGHKLGSFDVYVSASRYDPGPNHIIEAVACDLPTYTILNGGGACEFAGPDGVYKNFEELVKKLEAKNFEAAKPYDGWPITWESCAARFFDVIKKAANK